MRFPLRILLPIILVACAGNDESFHDPVTKRDLGEFDTLVIYGNTYRAAWSDIQLHSRDSPAVDEDDMSEMLGTALFSGVGAPAYLALIPVDYLARSVVHSATGAPRSPSEVSLAVRTFEQRFRPELQKHGFEAALASGLNEFIRKTPGPCIRKMRDRALCQVSNRRALLFVEAASGAASDAHGEIVVVTEVTALAVPENLLQPVCLSWRFKHQIGNIFDLYEQDGAALDKALRDNAKHISRETALGITEIISGRPRTSGAQSACNSAIYRINRDLAEEMHATMH